MQRLNRKAVLTGVLLVLVGSAGLRAADPPPEEVIRRFAAKEAEFKLARQSYTYRTRIITQILDERGGVAEERRILVETYFTTDGKRQHKTLLDEGHIGEFGVLWTQEDTDNALDIQPFVLTTEELPLYNVEYRGKEKADELDTYVFSVKPRRTARDQRYFEGKIWVDDRDFQIVKTEGKVVPEPKGQFFPRFETIRQMIDKKYWFPVWSMADDYMQVESGGGPSVSGTGMPFPLPFPMPGGRRSSGSGRRERVHIREYVTYESYKKFEVDSTIKYDAPVPETQPGEEASPGKEASPEKQP